jgi:hypothetical protein
MDNTKNYLNETVSWILTELTWPIQNLVVGSCERGHEPSSSVKDGEYLDQLNENRPLAARN